MRRAPTAPHRHAEVFAAERPRLTGLAYRMLGSMADADDVVQDAWLRWDAADRDDIRNPAAWLTTAVSRLALDRLRTRQRDRERYVGPWLPEPVLVDTAATGVDPGRVPPGLQNVSTSTSESSGISETFLDAHT